MITEDYVSFESAKLLKEKGFDERVLSFYTESGLEGYMFVLKATKNTEFDSGFISRPTLQLAMKWLREVYNIIIDVSPLSFNTKGSESFICNNWVFTLWENGNPIVSEFYGNQTAYPTYEEACESAIKCGLENLIEK